MTGSDELSPEEQLAANLPQIIEKWKALPRETRQEILAHLDTLFAFLSGVELESISTSSESLAKSSKKLVRLTDRLGWLTGLLIAETAVLIGLTLFVVSR
jgi:hypothetical protein